MNKLLSQLYYIQLHLAQLNSTFQTWHFKLDISNLTYYIRTQLNVTHQIWTHQTWLIKFELNYIRLIKLNSNRFNLSNLTQLLSQLDISNLMYYIWTRLNYFHNSITFNRSQLIKLNISNSNLSNLTYQTQFNQIQFIKLDSITFTTQLHSITFNPT